MVYIYIYGIYIYMFQKNVFLLFHCITKAISQINGFIYFMTYTSHTYILAQKKLPKRLPNICRIKYVFKLIHT